MESMGRGGSCTITTELTQNIVVTMIIVYFFIKNFLNI